MNEIEEKLINIDLDYYHSLKKLLAKKDMDMNFNDADRETFRNFCELVDCKIAELEDSLCKAQDDMSNESQFIINYTRDF